MKSVRWRPLKKTFRNLTSSHTGGNLRWASRCYGAPAVLKKEIDSTYEAARFPANDNSVGRVRSDGNSKVAGGPNAQGNVAKAARNGLKKSESSKTKERPRRRPRALQPPLDTSSKIVTTAHVGRVLDSQPDSALTWEDFLLAGRQPGFKHSIKTCHQMIQTFCETRKFDAVPELLGFMRKADIPLTSTACSWIVQGLARSGRPGEAAKIFRDILASGHRANTVEYNNYLSALVKAGEYDQIEAAYAEMLQHGLVPDVYTYSILINGFGRAKRTVRAWEAYCEMKARGCPPDAVICRTIEWILLAAGETEKVFQVMKEAYNRPIPPRNPPKMLSSSGTERTSASDGTEHSREGDIDRKPSGDKRILSLLHSREDLDVAMHALLDMVSRDEVPSTEVCNTAVHLLAKAREADSALELMRRLRGKAVLDSRSYEATISALCKASKVEEALQLEKEMQEQGFHASAKLCNELMIQLHVKRQPNRLFEFFSKLQNFKPTASTYVSLMSAVCVTDEFSRALRCLKDAGVIDYSLSTRVDVGLRLIHNIKNPRLSIYTLFLNNLCWYKRADDAVDLVFYMQENGLLMRLRNFSEFVEYRAFRKVLMLLSSQGKIEKSWKTFLRLKVVGIGNPEAEARIYGVMLKILRRASWFPQAFQVLEEMRNRGWPANVYAYTALMSSLGKEGKLDEMYRIFNLMDGDGCATSSITYDVLSRFFAEAGQVDKAHSFFEQGIEKGCIPSVLSYNTLLRGYVRARRVPDAIDLYNVMMAMGCKPNGTTYNIVHRVIHNAGQPNAATPGLDKNNH